jgi:hypothetical protein
MTSIGPTRGDTTRRAIVTAMLGIALVGCEVGGVEGPGGGGGGTPDAMPVDCDLGAQTAAVVAGGGTLQTGFLELPDGADMEATLGPQGLYMVTPAIRTQGIYPGKSGSVGDPNDPMVKISILKGSEEIGGSAASRIGMSPSADGAVLLQIFSPFTVAPTEYDGLLVTIEATVSDACGHTVVDSLQVVPRQQ